MEARMTEYDYWKIFLRMPKKVTIGDITLMGLKRLPDVSTIFKEPGPDGYSKYCGNSKIIPYICNRWIKAGTIPPIDS